MGMNLIEELGGYEKAKKLLGMFGILRTEFIDGVYKKDLQAALADYDRTDYVSDIRNHIAPTTKVIER